MSSGHNGHSVPNNRGTRNNRRGRNTPQHIPATPRGPQASTLVPAPRQAPKPPPAKPATQRPQQPIRAATPSREIDPRQNGHTPAMPSATQAPQTPRAPLRNAPAPRPAPRIVETSAETPLANSPRGDDTTVEVESVLAETFVVVEPAHLPERPAPRHVEQAHPPVTRAAPPPPARDYEVDDSPATGAQPVVRPPRHERTTRDRVRYVHVPGTVDVRGDVGPLIDDLHALFERDRVMASQGNTARCGVCYFHFAISDLVYRDAEGFYVCPGCERALGQARMVMLRRQQRG